MKTFANLLSALKIILFFLLLTTELDAQINGSITGSVLDKSTKAALEGATIKLENTGFFALTDSSGRFRLTGIPVKSYNLVASSVGYRRLVLYNIVINSGNEENFTIELERSGDNLEEVVVRSSRRTARAATLETPLSVQKLTSEEIKSNPGGNFDISKVIQTLPGVGGGQQGGSFRNDIIVRGGAPNENVFYLDGIEVPVINHFQTQGSSGGPQGILNVSFIEDVTLSSSAFDARYDNAISSVFQFRQKTGNPTNFQGNFRLSATDAALTLEGPIEKSGRTTFLASARRSYLQVLFKAIDLPIRPNYWDFQTKISHQLNKKTILTVIGLGAIDEFRFEAPKETTPEKLYTINANPLINQWNYTAGISIRKSISNGFFNVALSRTTFNNDIKKYEDNENPVSSDLSLDINSAETENKLRFDINKELNGWKYSYGASVQLVDYSNSTFNIIRKEVSDENGNVIQPQVIFNFESPLNNFWKFGAFAQLGKRFFDNRLGVNAGLRTDLNSFTDNGMNPGKTISPRISVNYSFADKWSWNTSVGSYFKLPPFTILGFADNNGELVNRSNEYLKSNHYTAGFEFVPKAALRFTLEGFYKQYSNVPVSIRDGIALSNLGADFNVLGNEPILSKGKGKTYGVELFIQKKLANNFFGILSYTWYRSLYSGADGEYISSSWDNRHLLSFTAGYKFSRNWELGLKFRYQGGAPYTPFDEPLSRINFLSLGKGTFDYARLNALRLKGFNSSDIRIDKKWNIDNFTIDLFLDITNWYLAKNPSIPEYTFTRTPDNSAFATTDGQPVKPDGSNAIPVNLISDDALFTPSIGLIIEF